jgi:hypothetical protein
MLIIFSLFPINKDELAPAARDGKFTTIGLVVVCDG